MNLDSLPFIFVDFDEIKLDSGKHLTSLTWLVDEPYSDLVENHHYFIAYPGAREGEEKMIEALGEGSPLTRYSVTSVLLAFSNNVTPDTVVIAKSQEAKQRLLHYLSLCNVPFHKSIYLQDDVLTETEKSDIIEQMELVKLDAAQRFGNAI